MRVALASGNRHKLREVRTLFPGWEVEPLDMSGAPEETGETFYANARAKARFAHAVAGAGTWVLGEDSGLEVDGLQGRPGIRSARYAGPEATDEANVQQLLAELGAAAGAARRARYVSELVLVSPEGRELRGSGTLAGRIAEEPRGSGGFGYDPVFVPDGETHTVGELGDAWKARNSHRARAARALAETVGTAPEEG